MFVVKLPFSIRVTEDYLFYILHTFKANFALFMNLDNFVKKIVLRTEQTHVSFVD